MADSKKGWKLTRIYRGCLAGFFLIMFVCTIVSRIYDSVTIPKVSCQRMKEKTIETVVRGTGTVKQQELFFCPIASGYRVKSVEVLPGSQVEEGDVLFCFDLNSLEEKKKDREKELKKLRLEQEKEKIAGEIYPQITETELADRELELALRELEEGQEEYEEKAKEHEEELERLKKDYEKKRVMTGDELWLQQDREEEAVWQEIHSAKNSRNADIRDARRKIADLEEELEEMESEEQGEKELSKKRRELARAKEDLKDIEEQWEDRIDDAESRMDLIDDQNRRILSGETSSQEALKEAYEETVRQQESQWKEERKKLETLQKAVEQARWQRENAIKRDQYTQLSEQQSQRLSLLSRQERELDIREKEQELESISRLMAQQGQVRAEREGTVVDQEVEAGKTSTGEERLSLASGSFCFEGEFEKEEQNVVAGDVLAVMVPGTNKSREAVIQEIRLLGEKGVFRARFSDLELPLGTVSSYECKRESAAYQQVIPLEGLRKDMKGYYCLVARPRKAILGEEFRAERIDVRLIYKGSTEAAVEGGLQESDPIIIRSNQVIGEGDRVRLAEE